MIILASEDKLIENICLRLLGDLGVCISDVTKICPGGKTKLQARVPAIYRSAMGGIPAIVCTDLDNEACPFRMTENWFPNKIPRKMIFSVAVREADAWLLADEELAVFLSSKRQALAFPEEILDPKAELLKIAKNSKSRKIRTEMLVSQDALNRVGPGYNFILSEFVSNHWNHDQASKKSSSLKRFKKKLEELIG